MDQPLYPDSARSLALANALEAFGISDVDCARILGLDLLTVQSMAVGTVTMSQSNWCSVFCALSFEWRKRSRQASAKHG